MLSLALTLHSIVFFAIILYFLCTHKRKEKWDSKWYNRFLEEQKRKSDEEFKRHIREIRKEHGVYLGDKWDKD